MKHRVDSQISLLLKVLKDGQPHSTVEILRRVYNLPGDKGIARIGARVMELREEGYEIEGKPGRLNKKVWWYRLSPKEKPEPIRMVSVQMADRTRTRVRADAIPAGAVVLPE